LWFVVATTCIPIITDTTTTSPTSSNTSTEECSPLVLVAEPECEGDMALLALAQFVLHHNNTNNPVSSSQNQHQRNDSYSSLPEGGSLSADSERDCVGASYLAAVHAAHWGVDLYLAPRHVEALKEWTECVVDGSGSEPQRGFNSC
jgi:hypothetical protein